MKALALVLLLSGCATWQVTVATSAKATHEAASGIQRIALPIYATKCEEAARECHAAKDPKCPKLSECQESRKRLQRSLDGIDLACAAAVAAAAMGQEQDARARIATAIQLLSDLYGALRKMGVL